MKLIVADLETSGLNVASPPATRAILDTPDCILEVGVVVLDANLGENGAPPSFKELARFEQLVLPPMVSNVETFDMWATNLREKNSFVHNMHTESGLLAALRVVAGSEHEMLYHHSEVESFMIELLERHTDLPASPKPMHPGNSDLIFTGNSIANLDIPMFRLWMPKLLEKLSYRIMDVSVLRTFYTQLACVPLPPELDAAIKSGGGGHRALSDAVWCADSLRKLVDFVRDPPSGSWANLTWREKQILAEAEEQEKTRSRQ